MEVLTSTNLQDEQAFRSFSECPHFDREDGVYGPLRHWCYLGEITERVVFTRLCLTVKDKKGDKVIVSFYLDSDKPGIFNFPVHRNVPEPLTNRGNTIAILYAQQHNFLDGSIGFRIEDAEKVQFFPCTLGRLLALGDRILSSATQPDGVPACYRCKTTAGARQRCSGCRVSWYCNKDCQEGDWSDGGHRKDCKLLNQVATLMRQDWEHFYRDKFYSFPLPKE